MQSPKPITLKQLLCVASTQLSGHNHSSIHPKQWQHLWFRNNHYVAFPSVSPWKSSWFSNTPCCRVPPPLFIVSLWQMSKCIIMLRCLHLTCEWIGLEVFLPLGNQKKQCHKHSFPARHISEFLLAVVFQTDCADLLPRRKVLGIHTGTSTQYSGQFTHQTIHAGWWGFCCVVVASSFIEGTYLRH